MAAVYRKKPSAASFASDQLQAGAGRKAGPLQAVGTSPTQAGPRNSSDYPPYVNAETDPGKNATSGPPD